MKSARDREIFSLFEERERFSLCVCVCVLCVSVYICVRVNMNPRCGVCVCVYPDPGNRAAVVRSCEALGLLHVHVVPCSEPPPTLQVYILKIIQETTWCLIFGVAKGRLKEVASSWSLVLAPSCAHASCSSTTTCLYTHACTLATPLSC